MAQALGAVCSSAANNIGSVARAAIIELVEDAFAETRNGELARTARADRAENYNLAIGKIVAGLAKHDPEIIRSLVE